MRTLWLALLALALPQLAVAQAARPDAKRPPPRAGIDAGMVVTGEQEAPQVLTIVPWQEAKPHPAPEAPRVPPLPVVLDSERGLADEALSRAVPAGGK